MNNDIVRANLKVLLRGHLLPSILKFNSLSLPRNLPLSEADPLNLCAGGFPLTMGCSEDDLRCDQNPTTAPTGFVIPDPLPIQSFPLFACLSKQCSPWEFSFLCLLPSHNLGPIVLSVSTVWHGGKQWPRQPCVCRFFHIRLFLRIFRSSLLQMFAFNRDNILAAAAGSEFLILFLV